MPGTCLKQCSVKVDFFLLDVQQQDPLHICGEILPPLGKVMLVESHNPSLHDHTHSSFAGAGKITGYYGQGYNSTSNKKRLVGSVKIPANSAQPFSCGGWVSLDSNTIDGGCM
jgi:hypothetical protein